MSIPKPSTNLQEKSKLIVILGPNASGKTGLAIKLAKKFNGEIISADSRQIYKGMDIGTGKTTKSEQKQIKHHLIDIIKPSQKFDVATYKKLAIKTINKIHKKYKLPFLVGGTGFYIQAIVDNIDFPKVKPNWKLRRKLEKYSISKLFKILKKLDPARSNTIDKNNPRRLIRAIEIAKAGQETKPIRGRPLFNTLILGLTHPKEKLYKLIDQRLEKRFRQGMVAEVKKLHKQGISWKRLNNFGLEYRYISLYLQGKLTKEQMIEQLKNAIHHYAKRQMTWFSAHGGSASGGQNDKRICWIKNQKEAQRLIQKFIK